MEKGLQKFTETDWDKMLEKPLTHEIIDSMDTASKVNFLEYMNRKINTLKGVEYDKFWTNVEPITAESTKNEVWERNHIKTTYAIGKLMIDYGRMPAVSEICEEAGLSRVTVTKHMKEYKNSPQYHEQIEHFKFMRDKVLAKAYRFAVEGDMRAAKLFLEYTGGNSLKGDTINTQNNYIQINQFKITQDEIQQLTPEQIDQIEKIIYSGMKKRRQ